MLTTRIKRQELMETLQRNRTKHQNEYVESVAGWLNVMKIWLAELRDELDTKEAGDIKTYCPHDKPLNYADSYDRAIAMLEVNVEETVVLDERQFEQYVLDNWDWKGAHVASNTKYAITGRR